MAHMYPTPLRTDTDSPAEILLYEKFTEQLPDDYHVFHSVAWQARSGRHWERDGEADFVIIHPEKGILVIEAKAGQITFDGPSGTWYQNRRPMSKDPFEQAKRSRYHLRNTLQEEIYWRRRNVCFGHAVAFPFVTVPDYPLTLQAPSMLILDQRACQDTKTWLDNIYDYYGGHSKHPIIDPEGMKYLINLLAPVRELRSLMGLDIRSEQAEFVRLTENQYRILNYLAAMPRVAIAGCAGSGKTMLAAEKARRLAAQGWRVLFTCFNRNLATFLRNEYLAERPDKLVIEHFHELAGNLVKRSGLPFDVPQSDSEAVNHFFSETLPEQLVDAAGSLGPQFDAIVVDEAQDFQENWWVPLQFLLENPDEGTFYLFYDDNQNIYGGIRRIKNLAPEVLLNENLRNTRRINTLVRRFYLAEHEVKALGPDGRDVEVHAYSSDHEMSELLRKTLHHLVREEEVAPEDIVILTPRSPSKTHLSQVGRLGSFYLTRNWDLDYNQIFYETIHSFKGLESPVVILTELTDDLHHAVDELLYVGCSRARSHLVVLCHKSIANRFTEA